MVNRLSGARGELQTAARRLCGIFLFYRSAVYHSDRMSAEFFPGCQNLLPLVINTISPKWDGGNRGQHHKRSLGLSKDGYHLEEGTVPIALASHYKVKWKIPQAQQGHLGAV